MSPDQNQPREERDAWRSRCMRLSMTAQALVDAIDEADHGTVGRDPRIECALAELKQEMTAVTGKPLNQPSRAMISLGFGFSNSWPHQRMDGCGFVRA